MGERKGAWLRVLASVALLFHLTAVSASVLYGSAVGDALRRGTRPYEHLLGVYQQWNMFAPNAPRATEWMEIQGVVAGGGDAPVLEAMAGRPSHAVKWTYSRRSKFERQLLGNGKGDLRAGIARWSCLRAADEGLAVTAVEVWRVSMRTPRPADRAAAGPWEERRTLLERWPCP